MNYAIPYLTNLVLVFAVVVSQLDAARSRRRVSRLHDRFIARGEELIAAYGQVTTLGNALAEERARRHV